LARIFFNRLHHLMARLAGRRLACAASHVIPKRDIASLETLFRDTRAVLVIIDPITAYLGEKTDSHSNTDVRRVLAPLAALAERCSVSVLAVTHDRKGGGAAGERTLGSVAFTAAPRAVWAVTPETGEDGAATCRTIFTRIKGNLGPDPGGLAYEIEPYRIGSGSEPDGIATSRIKWLPGVITKTADELYATASEGGLKTREAPHRDEAQDFLRELLASGSKPVTEIEAEAQGRRNSAHDLAARSRKASHRAQKERLLSWRLALGVAPKRGCFGPIRNFIKRRRCRR
jgi:putative DNA primase/helicase